MKLQSATIKDFKRFTHLTIQNIPPSARLIMLAGPNGCGKSSLFDALHTWNESISNRGIHWEPDYHVKGHLGEPDVTQWNNQVQVQFHDYSLGDPEQNRKAFYIRSAYRNDPEFQIDHIQRTGDLLDEVRILRMIDNDAAVGSNYRRLVANAIEDVFERGDSSITLDAFREQVTEEIREPFARLFPDMKFNSLGNPMSDGTFRFTKGTSERFSFKNLSGGEKSVFDLILDLVVAKRSYDNTVFCIDEPESHMNARLQANLLEVLYDLIPRNCQLFLATHSIGMMRRARDIEKKNPRTVAFLDFGGRDFDEPQVIEPTTPNRHFWHQAYEVALDDLAALVAPSIVVICEGEPTTGRPARNHNHDARCYDAIFAEDHPETRFVSMGSDQQIQGDKRGLAEALQLLISEIQIVRLIDRDDRTETTIAEEKAKGIKVLSRRNLESYLYDDEVLTALARSEGFDDKVQELLNEKNCILSAINNRASDDLKPAAGQIFNSCRRILGLTQRGNNAEEFARETLSPLIKPGMAVYDELRRDIFE